MLAEAQLSPKELGRVRILAPLLVYMKNFTDEQLVKNYLRGNEKSLEELVRRYPAANL